MEAKIHEGYLVMYDTPEKLKEKIEKIDNGYVNGFIKVDKLLILGRLQELKKIYDKSKSAPINTDKPIDDRLWSAKETVLNDLATSYIKMRKELIEDGLTNEQINDYLKS